MSRSTEAGPGVVTGRGQADQRGPGQSYAGGAGGQAGAWVVAGPRSMTGQGAATRSGPWGVLRVEIRSVNHKGFKCSVRTGDALAALAARIETAARAAVQRGSLAIAVHWKPPAAAMVSPVDEAAALAYADTIRRLQERSECIGTVDWAAILQLPGCLTIGPQAAIGEDQIWPPLSQTLADAVAALDQMREIEGESMAISLRADLELIRGGVSRISGLAPDAARRHHERLQAKIVSMLQRHDLQVDSVDLIREVQVYADRVDISEELTRLDSHLAMFEATLGQRQPPGVATSPDPPRTPAPTPAGPSQPAPVASAVAGNAAASRREPCGRKLDFITQEMFRETNTIGSKASDARVAAEVVDIKCAIERMRELVQNLE